MVRLLVKGGVWKNTEDEILKAAVMKYGKNQWARVASLLNRKSAAQCKARWYEWLDPSIKKIDWSREEDEKLLHLAKLMPNQWRTLAPIVGRTAGQCMERYEQLLDEAQEAAEAVAAAADSGATGTLDPRKLRPGEIDPAPETRPARPDPIDMDDDEKEMLAEARARLANTQGKKAKRKARERQLEESKRLAVLQKRRELKAAGIESKLGGNLKRKYIDYKTEIPFQKLTPAGFYDVGEENVASKRMKNELDPKTQGLEITKLEGRNRKEEEEKQKEKDKKRLKTLFKANAPLAILKQSEVNDVTSLRVRVGLSLPAPQVTDSELEDIVKIGQNALMAPPEGGLSKRVTNVTQSLLGDYSSLYKPTPTPLRTPKQDDVIMQEARNAIAMNRVGVVPLAGGELPELYEGTGFDGVAPRNIKLATPNLYLNPGDTPLRTPASSVMGSIASVSSTPLRDQFGLNDPHADSFSVSDTMSISSRGEKIREREYRAQLASQLSSLPEPEYIYDIAIPTIEEEETQTKAEKPVDAVDEIEQNQRIRAAMEEEELARRSTVLRRQLPRPKAIPKSLANPTLSVNGYDETLVRASGFINEEMVKLMTYDSIKYPITTNGNINFFELEQMDDGQLQIARELILEEVGKINNDMNVADIKEQFAKVWEEKFKEFTYLPSKGELCIPINKSDMLEGYKSTYDVIKSKIEKDSKIAGKLEAKLKLVTQGYVLRTEKLASSISASYEELESLKTNLTSYSMLAVTEKRMLPKRSNQLQVEMNEVIEQESKLQFRYSKLSELINSKS